jgi:tRNA (guanosine-2'-O-)-methyltransferase
MLTDERRDKILDVIAKRQWNITVVLENVHDPHNVGAVLRSCESIGITEVYLIYTELATNPERYIGRNATGGVSKWIKSRFFNDIESCFKELKSKYDKVYATHLYSDSKDIYNMNLTESCAFVFGNEHAGISEELLNRCDGNVTIPIHGMAESLNISVACSVILYEAMRQRTISGEYNKPFDLNNESQHELLRKFVRNTKPRIFDKKPEILMDPIYKFLKKG